MAWGDLRFDHSDIFNPTLAQRKEQKRERKATAGPPAARPKRTPLWDQVLRACSVDDGQTAHQIRERLGYDRPTGNVQSLLERMVDAGVLRRERESIGNRGQKPFVYYKVEKR